MKIGFTADIHFNAEKETPVRYKALEQILIELKENNISYLIIAGDTFDKGINKYEKGIYMPISIKIINEFKPLKIFLGHIHKPCEYEKIIYPVSPQSIDINETDKKKDLLFMILFQMFFFKTNSKSNYFFNYGRPYKIII